MKKHLSPLSIITVVVFLLIATGTYLFLGRNRKDAETAIYSNGAETTSQQPSAQAEFTQGTEREPGNSLNEGAGSASISDSRGAEANQEDNQTTLSSDSGKITLSSPYDSSVLANGSIINGVSSLARVNYRIIDDVSGVIATGSLEVVDGKFSGRIQFETSANKGRLDIFGLNDDLTEHSNIEVSVSFNE
jgi:hypothetical protein